MLIAQKQIEPPQTQVAFSFDSPSPMILQAVAPGSLLASARIFITTPFDGVAPVLRLGTIADPSALLELLKVSLDHVSQYENNELVLFGALEFLRLSITPSTSTTGEGILFYQVRTP